MSDVKSFTGFIAIDGSTHKTMKEAVDFTRIVKIKKALADNFAGLTVTVAGSEMAQEMAQDMADFLFENMALVTAAFTQGVLTRKKRTPRVKVVMPTGEAA